MDVAAITFDTHRVVKRLTAAGMRGQQAAALTDEQVPLLNTNLATTTGLAATEARLPKWMVSAMFLTQSGSRRTSTTSASGR